MGRGLLGLIAGGGGGGGAGGRVDSLLRLGWREDKGQHTFLGMEVVGKLVREDGPTGKE